MSDKLKAIRNYEEMCDHDKHFIEVTAAETRENMTNEEWAAERIMELENERDRYKWLSDLLFSKLAREMAKDNYPPIDPEIFSLGATNDADIKQAEEYVKNNHRR